MASKLSPAFSVTRKPPELIVPAEPTPHEVKQLSDIDDQEGLRFQIPLIFFYRNNPSSAMKGKDPVKVIREALGRALVFYYPLAGRLMEVSSNRKLLVDCNGEGILFIEADADVTIDQLRHAIQPPFPCLDELLFNVPGSDGILGCPLFIFQVTRLSCGGFIMAFRYIHALCDAFGMMQFLKTMEEMVQAALSPSLMPVWQREILNARDPPLVTCIHHEYEQLDDTNDTLKNTKPKDMDHKSFFFGPEEMRSLRRQLPPHLINCSTFELLSACVWRCRTTALQLDADEIVRISCVINVRNKRYDIDIPPGYYGNAFAYPAVCSKAELLCKKPLGYAVELVRRTKAQMNGEYIRSVADLMVTKGRPLFTTMENFIVSQITTSGISEFDFGWGKPVYGGTTGALSLISFFMKYQNMDGKDGTLIPLCLPTSNMKRFEEELKKMIQRPMEDSHGKKFTETVCKL